MVNFRRRLFILSLRRSGLIQIKRRRAELYQALSAEIERDLAAIDEALRWATFEEYCNTPCWRYRCQD
ncbi:MAG: hypothetical protein DRQ62_09930 [Gammaproteobacteria bacterium]|nr:MAG: hypothetical protein DRQ62_09930 [Gammaproteobacteria bacterium]